MALELEQVSKRYGRRGPLVLRDVSASIPAGALVHVVGENGCGKSTLLRVLARVSAPTGGRVRGVPASVGYVPERFPPALRSTPRQYLGHLARIRGLPAAAVTGPAELLLERLGAPGIGGTPMAELSKGTAQKVAVVQALVPGPDLLVLDEAFTGLDRDAQGVLAAEVQTRHAAGTTVVFTDHGGRARSLAPDLRLALPDGALTAAAASVPAPAVVLLADPSGAFDPGVLPGVLRVDRTDDGTRVDVDPAGCDGLLLAALSAGCSVLRVERRP